MKKHSSLISLSSEELAKAPTLTKEQIEDALRKGWEEVKASFSPYPRCRRNL